MAVSPEYQTDRLVIRQWRESDRQPFAAMNADARVMRYFPRHFRHDESDRFIDCNVRSLSERGWGNWAVELKSSERFAGFVGLSEPPEWHPCSERIEIGWRLAPEFWGAGVATEAARAVVQIGFDVIGLKEIISYTTVTNLSSIAVMRKLGMCKEGCFDHPRIPVESDLCKHVVYVLANDERAIEIVLKA